jgi:RiboL-PSP-HEPN
MKSRSISQNKDRLDHLFDQAKQIDDDLIRGHWARYLCVLVSGFIETSIQTILREYARNKSSPDIGHFVSQQIRDFQNAKMEKILGLLSDFSPEISARIRVATDGELKDAIDSVVQNRHQIAHGQQSGISLATIKDYYDNVVRVIDVVEAEFPA